jgi:hypothetical protein
MTYVIKDTKNGKIYGTYKTLTAATLAISNNNLSKIASIKHEGGIEEGSAPTA